MAYLRQDFFARGTVQVAKDLVGAVLEATSADGTLVSGRIVEVEAYGGQNDPASHAGRGRTPRSQIMFGPPGFAYVYFIYGMHHCLNFVTEPDGTAGAVLVRALEPVAGREVMAARRGLDPETVADRALAAGPGRLCQALGIDLGWNRMPVVPGLAGPVGGPGSLRVLTSERPPARVASSARIGISRATDHPNRFFDPESPCLSA